MNDLQIQAPPDVAAEVPGFLTWARSLVVTTPDVLSQAAEKLKAIKGSAKRLADFFKPMKQKADENKKAILDAEKKLSLPLAEAEQLIKGAMLTYSRQEEEKRLAEQRRIQAEADERARREREALEKKAAKMKTPEKQQQYMEQAAAVVAPVVQVPSAAPAIAGIATRKIWKAQIVDAALVPREFLCVDERKLDQYAKAMREGANVAGVRFYTQESLAAKAS